MYGEILNNALSFWPFFVGSKFVNKFINKFKRSELSKEPYGTPAITTSDKLVLLFMTTFCCLYFK